MRARGSRTIDRAWARSGARTILAIAGVLAIGFSHAQRASVTTNAEAGKDTVEWLTLSGGLAHTRYSPAKQIDAEQLRNAEDCVGLGWRELQGAQRTIDAVVCERQAVSRSQANAATSSRSTRSPVKPSGRIASRTPARYEYSMRKDYGKGVAYAEDRRAQA